MCEEYNCRGGEMTENWMISVLADLRKFAKDNHMAKLAEQLDDTMHIAASEMATESEQLDIPDRCPGDTAEFLQPAYVV
jgi:hypothetical protein